jgi:simple sugar transport system permease protein
LNIPQITFPARITTRLLIKLVIAAGVGLLFGGIFTLMAGHSPLTSYQLLMSAGFSCREWDHCAILTTFQFATPLILAGLSAAVAFRAGFFSIGQAGQMVLGAGAAAWVGYQVFPAGIHPFLAMLGAALVGAIWAIIPGILKLVTGVHEIIVTVIMNSIAGYIVSFIPLRYGRIELTARLDPLAPGTKLNSGFFLAFTVAVLAYYFLWHTAAGYEQRMVGQAPAFARYGGQNQWRSVIGAMCLSGALAGLAGGLEVLGVHYQFITNFSADANFDGVMVALLGQSHPMGVLISGIFVGGIRLGSLNGLLIQAGIPRELGNAILAVMMIFMAANQFLSKGGYPRFNLKTLTRNIGKRSQD